MMDDYNRCVRCGDRDCCCGKDATHYPGCACEDKPTVSLVIPLERADEIRTLLLDEADFFERDARVREDLDFGDPEFWAELRADAAFYRELAGQFDGYAMKSEEDQ